MRAARFVRAMSSSPWALATSTRWHVVWPSNCPEPVGQGVPLARYTSLRVGGRAEWLFEPRSVQEAAAVLRACHARGMPVHVLGGGFNLLVSDEQIPGAVIATGRLRRRSVSDERVEVGAGDSFPRLVHDAATLGVPVLPGLPGIPGSVGGVVCMNAGGRHGCVSEALLEVEALELDGTLVRRAVSAADFGYRSSAFDGMLITGAVFRRAAVDAARARRLHDEALAHKRRTQPLGAASAGCIFRNPDGPSGPRSAGWLIEDAGLKGARVGGAVVSERHANFIVNEGQATAAEIEALIAHIQAAVEARHGLRLQLEVRRWGSAAPVALRP